MEAEKRSEMMKKIEDKIKESCSISKYTLLCKRISTTGGLAFVVNRCIDMMADYKMPLSGCLAQLESEFESN